MEAQKMRAIDYEDVEAEGCCVIKNGVKDGEIIKQRGRFYYCKKDNGQVLKVLLFGKLIQDAMLDWQERQYYYSQRMIEQTRQDQALALVEDTKKRFNLPLGTTVNINISVLKLTINR